LVVKENCVVKGSPISEGKETMTKTMFNESRRVVRATAENTKPCSKTEQRDLADE